MQKIPQCVFEQAIRDFPNRYPNFQQTRDNTFMVSLGRVCMYYILNRDNTKIVDIQVD